MPASEFRCEVSSADVLRQLAGAPLPLGLRAAPPAESSHRDVYLDTPDGALLRRDATCRFRLSPDDRRVLTLCLREPGGVQRYEAEVIESDLRAALAGTSEPARRLQGLVDPTQLRPRVELETERTVRLASAGWLSRSRFAFVYDLFTVRAGGLWRTTQEIKVRRLRAGRPALEQVAQALRAEQGLRPQIASKLERARALVAALENEVLVRALGSGRAVAVIGVEEGRIALLCEPRGLRLPAADGSGEQACRHLMRERLGSAVGELQLLGTAPALGTRPALEVWLARRLRRDVESESSPRQWLPLDEVLARIGSPPLRDPLTLAALTVAAGRTDLLPEWPRQPLPRVGDGRRLTALPEPRLPAAALDTRQPDPEHFLNEDLSQLEFQARVLTLAADRRLPWLERLNYLAIVSSNLDEFFSVRVAANKRRAADASREASRSPDGLTAAETLSAIQIRVRSMMRELHGALGECLSDPVLRLVRWADVETAEQERLRAFFVEQVSPLLTPRAVTVSPGHPFPSMPSLALCFAAFLRGDQTGPLHCAFLRLPSALPRFLPLQSGEAFTTLEDVVRANLPSLYPDRRLEHAALFRITRSGDLDVDEQEAGDLVQAVEEEVGRRRQNPVVRLEVESGVPRPIRESLLREFQTEGGGETGPLGETDIYEAEGMLDLGGLRGLARLPIAAQRFVPFAARSPLPAGAAFWEALRERDRLVYHPYDAFQTTVQRFFEEAADDPQVAAIKVTLYRAGTESPLVDALLRAARAGKEVTVFVEVKARFDEERNVGWTRRLEAAGIPVVAGLVGLKTHAKATLVVRREAGALRRYVHLGTGNYNASTAGAYTDLGLFSADPELGEDVGALFNELTGASRPPAGPFRRLLVAPTSLLPGLLERIDAEAEHARAGRGGSIRAKLNGLSECELVRALYRASQAGVAIDLVVRGLCALRPGVPGLSENIRVVSILGRFLEHARIYRFGNGGAPQHWIGSADWRARNLRGRVETAVPVRDPEACRRLDQILERERNDPLAWDLGPDGVYTRRCPPEGAPSTTAQEAFLAELEP